jgi:hypothetical protein
LAITEFDFSRGGRMTGCLMPIQDLSLRRLSRFLLLHRLPGMNSRDNGARRWLAVTVAAHLLISVLHGAAHAGAHIPLSREATLFVSLVIVAGPLAGLILTWMARRVGGWLVALTMAGSFAFGLVNHFLVGGSDHVAHVDEPWRWNFATTAIGLAVTEALAVSLAIRVARLERSAA